MDILSEHYHFDRQWKELERPNASFEGRTTHPIIRSVENNTAEKKLLLFRFFSAMEEDFSHTHAYDYCKDTHTYITNYY